MESLESLSREFDGLRRRYALANERMMPLQATAVEGLRKIGVGCLTEESKAEFLELVQEISAVLDRMRKICESLH